MLKPPAPSSSPKLRLCPTKSERGVHSSSEPRGKCQQPSDGESGDCGAFWSVGRSTIKRFETAASPPRYKRESSPLENLTSAPDSHQESAWEVARASVALKRTEEKDKNMFCLKFSLGLLLVAPAALGSPVAEPEPEAEADPG